jgi:hypothetical protein
VTSTGKFFLSLVAVSSHEDTPAILNIFNFIKDKGVTPKYVVGDAAGAITNAVEQCWGSGPERVMCWAHATRAIDRSDRLKAVRAINADFASKMMEDLDKLQWMATNEATFRVVFGLYRDKYKELAHTMKAEYPDLSTTVESLLSYMSTQWVVSKEFKWFEGANPWGPGHNQSIEGINKGIKENYTFRTKLEMGELFR